MIIDVVLLCVGLVGLIIGSITDIQRREVPDWISYALIFSGLGLRLMHSVYTFEWSYFLYGLLGFGAYLALAYAMFYTGQWGGGDSKVLMGMGAIFATYPEMFKSIFSPELFGFPFLVSFWVNLLLVGAIYGLLWTLGLGFVHFKEMRVAFKEWMSKPFVKKIKLYVHITSGILILLAILLPDFMLKMIGGVFGIMILSFFYMYIAIKAVEKSCMYRQVTPEKLVEGDWPVHDIIVDGKDVFPKAKKLGFEIDDIDLLKKLHDQGKIASIKIKHGVPFVPSFLFALIITVTYGNIITLMIF